MRNNLVSFVERIQQLQINFTCNDFETVDYKALGSTDFVYCDPPYLISIGVYNDGKRGFKGWGAKEEITLLLHLDQLNKNNVRFALSNVLDHKGKSNDILKEWITANNYTINPILGNYSNSSYNTLNRDKNSSVEVLITNYTPHQLVQKALF